jgi:hypothetical protein
MSLFNQTKQMENEKKDFIFVEILLVPKYLIIKELEFTSY